MRWQFDLWTWRRHTVPREMVTATVRWMGVPEAQARLVEVMYERTKCGWIVVGCRKS